MNGKLLASLLLVAPIVPAMADIKRLDCMPSNATAGYVVHAVIDDATDKAEAQVYGNGAQCASSKSCETAVYQKDVLPSVIRLTRTQDFGPLAGFVIATVVDIDRTTLSVTLRVSTKSSGGNTESTYTGTCKMTVDESKKLL